MRSTARPAAPTPDETSSYAPVLPQASPVALEVAQEVAIERGRRGGGARVSAFLLRRLGRDCRANTGRTTWTRPAEDLLRFWLDEVGPDGWYRGDDALDAAIRDRWGALWDVGRDRRARRTGRCAPRSSAGARDPARPVPAQHVPRRRARLRHRPARAAVAKVAVLHGRDQRVPLPERQFFYLPLMHSEMPSDQDKSVRLVLLNFGRDASSAHARAHREIIRRFGRFPYRNAALGRESTPDEVAFLAEGGYRAADRQAGGLRTPAGRSARQAATGSGEDAAWQPRPTTSP